MSETKIKISYMKGSIYTLDMIQRWISMGHDVLDLQRGIHNIQKTVEKDLDELTKQNK